MSQIRVVIAVAGLLMALAPVGVGAQALTNEDIIAANRAAMAAAIQQANLANDLARCKIASAGGFVSGTVAFSQPNPGGCMTTPATPAASSTPAPGTCVAATRALTKAELDKVNEFEIAAADAIADAEPPLMPTPDIIALTC
jgi:hypothetical protein